jgi:hypothetical protein
MNGLERRPAPAAARGPDLTIPLWKVVCAAALTALAFGTLSPSADRFQSRGYLVCMVVAGCFAALIGLPLVARPALVGRFAHYVVRTSPHPRWHGVVMLWLGLAYLAIFAAQLAVPIPTSTAVVLFLAALASTLVVLLLPRLRDALVRGPAAR